MKHDIIAYRILSIALIINVLCLNIVSAILGIFSLVYINKYIKLKVESYIVKAKILITIGYLVFIIDIIVGFIVNFGETIVRLIIH